MPMTKTQKETVVAEIAQMLDANTIVYLTNYSGLTVSQANDLRNRFRDAGVSFKVYKNTLVRLAMEERPAYSELVEYLKGLRLLHSAGNRRRRPVSSGFSER